MQAFPLFWGSPLFLYNPLWLLLSCQSCPTAHTAPSLRWGSTARPASTAAREVQAEHAVTPAQGSERHCSISRATGKRRENVSATSLFWTCLGAFEVQHQADKFLLPLGHISTCTFQPLADRLLYSAVNVTSNIPSSLHIPNLGSLQRSRCFQPAPHAHPESLRSTRSQALTSHTTLPSY